MRFLRAHTEIYSQMASGRPLISNPVAVSFIYLSGHYYMFSLSLKKFLEGGVVGHKFERGLPKANPSQVMTTAHVDFGYELKQVCQVTFLCLFYLLSLSVILLLYQPLLTYS